MRQAKLSTDWEVNKQTNRKNEKVQSGTGKQIDRQIPTYFCLHPKQMKLVFTRIIYLMF